MSSLPSLLKSATAIVCDKRFAKQLWVNVGNADADAAPMAINARHPSQTRGTAWRESNGCEDFGRMGHLRERSPRDADCLARRGWGGVDRGPVAESRGGILGGGGGGVYFYMGVERYPG